MDRSSTTDGGVAYAWEILPDDVLSESSVGELIKIRRENARRMLGALAVSHFGLSQRGLRIEHREGGRPFIPGFDRAGVSISYSREVVCVAISQGQAVGIDVEHAHLSYSASLFLRVVGAHPRAEDSRAESGLRFSRHWTRLEALHKCCGSAGLLNAVEQPELRDTTTVREIEAMVECGVAFSVAYDPALHP